MRQRITAVRGTTIPLAIRLTDEAGEIYELKSGEKLLFGVKKDTSSSSCLISKTMTSSDKSGDAYETTISPSETNSFEVGRYYYDVGFQTGNDFYNVIECSEFIVLPNITKPGVN